MKELLYKIACALCKALGNPSSTQDVPSPRDIIKQSDIKYDSVACRLTIDNVPPSIWLTPVADTNSLDPVVDAGHTCILTNNFRPDELIVGDIVVYNMGYGDIIHRIYKIGEDKEGRRFTLKGDNNPSADPYIVRDKNLRWLLLGIIY